MAPMNLLQFRERNKIFLSLLPEQILSLLAYGEARGEGEEGLRAVINVVNNRGKKGGWFPDKINLKDYSVFHQVILKPWQFSCFNLDDPNRKALEEIGMFFIESLGIYKVLMTAYDIAIQCVEGRLEDNTMGATYYHTKQMNPFPSWASKFKKTVEIKNQIFYKEGN